MLGSEPQENRTKLNVLITADPQDIVFCFNIPLEARYDFEVGQLALGHSYSHRSVKRQMACQSSVGAARKVSSHWSQETMTCHSSNCFSIVWDQGKALLVTSLPSSCDMTRLLCGLEYDDVSIMGQICKKALLEASDVIQNKLLQIYPS